MLIILLLFFTSGAIGLVDEVVWTRMLLYTFGTTTYSVVTVLSTFMAGLALGSAVLGRIADRQKNPIYFYGLLELLVGICSLLTIILLPLTQQIYRALYLVMPSPIIILTVKLVLSFLILFPSTFFMGGTLPTLIAALTRESRELAKKTSLLYAVNTFGAGAGTMFAGFISIELLGLTKTVVMACIGNFLIAGVVIFFTKNFYAEKKVSSQPVGRKTEKIRYDNKRLKLAVAAFAVSGLISMAYEVAWTRLLTPSVGTYIYAFAIILTLFLAGIALGSFLSKYVLDKTDKPLAFFGLIETGVGVMALLTVVITSQFVDVGTVGKVILVTLPATILMGATFPVVTAIIGIKEKIGRAIGAVYCANTIGSIAGPIIAGFILLPFLGTTKAILLLAVANLFLGLLLILSEKNWKNASMVAAVNCVFILGIFTIVIFAPELFYEKKLADSLKKFRNDQYEYLYTEDETASVLAYATGKNREAAVFVDGVSMSGLIEETKFMAHLPLFLIPNPQRALVICFGMGTTFRSALSHGIEVEGVELVPSVPKAFGLFYNDASQVLKNPKGKIIINDGRNYVFLAEKKYDLITVDPPPPINSAQTTVLYSKEFYEQGKKALNKNGIFTQWIFFYGSRRDDVGMMVRSFTEVFPYVAVYRGPSSWGMYLLGSNEPITIDKSRIGQRYKDERIYKDLNEWRDAPYTLDQIMQLYVGDQTVLDKLTQNLPVVTDDRPRTEYFLLRHKFSQSPLLYFIQDIDK